jgi:hypothetical protein
MVRRLKENPQRWYAENKLSLPDDQRALDEIAAVSR